ncbi:MAG TPA: hypothetical protein VF754_05285, partial [Pyrinomonadaceae bacterium]
ATPPGVASAHGRARRPASAAAAATHAAPKGRAKRAGTQRASRGATNGRQRGQQISRNAPARPRSRRARAPASGVRAALVRGFGGFRP